MLTFAAWEMGRLYRPLDINSSDAVTVAGALAILITRAYYPEHATAALAIATLVAMVVHMVTYERGRDRAATDFAITIATLVYLGWVGAYLIDLRNLPGGFGWFLLTLIPVWVGDSSAFYFGRKFGKHKMTPRLSPKKSWEGYFASIIGGAIGAVLTALILEYFGVLDVSLIHAGILGLLAGSLPTLGDLGESMIKRQANIKDSGNLIPGHGGAFDRIDSWIWAGAIGFFYVTWFIL